MGGGDWKIVKIADTVSENMQSSRKKQYRRISK